ncbi:MAG: bifunctional DNA-formamidopyrimidine glycosylase/DNA-(apurinic or apyrimidinic site) lyase [bacterium]|nr:bifunctional DNA-formamidopyrimidine glycosylase/DNA-(apurinic or apyrimidinic site) lyase [bacterium]MDE0287203.1 bifunctional DNA-formamidopyrimidine glycosylase/DNA-(apurinic or apyrimidinic site) lyase [bacterium]MDE0437142.1 bifunctional DNA-formamidopyrimidine glycosylase/DNA-(apurinic or apyrimidinic site) lyase [bacterium]
MPELPEVETTRRMLVPELAGRRIVSTRVLHPRMLRRQPEPDDFAARLEGRVVRSLARRGKFLMFDVGEGLTWVSHLGMSGHMAISGPAEPLGRHTRVVIETGSGREVRMIDPRTFGFVAVYTASELAASTLALLGPDALGEIPPAERLAAAVHGRRVAVKTLLLDQRFISGLGNIYSDEVLFEAHVDGSRPAGSLTVAEMASIRRAIRSVLEAGLSHGGTSLDDLAYLLPDGRAGRHLEYLSVYGREGRPCRSCRTPIRRSVIGARSSYRCPSCQT